MNIKDLLDEEKTISSLLSFNSVDSPTIFDVGANKGQTLVRYSKIFAPSRIYCFEPQPNIYRQLVKEAEGVSKEVAEVICLDYALGASTSSKMLYVVESNSGCSSSFSPINHSSLSIKRGLHAKDRLDGIEDQHYEMVFVRTLDDIVNEYSLSSIDLLKLDVQGHEVDVLKGASMSLEKGLIKIIRTECILDDTYTLDRLRFQTLVNILYDRNYRLYDISHLYKDLGMLYTSWMDLIFVHSSCDPLGQFKREDKV